MKNETLITLALIAVGGFAVYETFKSSTTSAAKTAAALAAASKTSGSTTSRGTSPSSPSNPVYSYLTAGADLLKAFTPLLNIGSGSSYSNDNTAGWQDNLTGSNADTNWGDQLNDQTGATDWNWPTNDIIDTGAYNMSAVDAGSIWDTPTP